MTWTSILWKNPADCMMPELSLALQAVWSDEGVVSGLSTPNSSTPDLSTFYALQLLMHFNCL